MDEEEELENTLIGQQEEAPAVNTGDALMGAGQPMFTADSNVVAAVPGIENIRNPGAFDPTKVEPIEPVGPPTTVGESIRQTYDESVLADLIGRGFGQEAFQSQAPDGTPTFSIFNKRFGTLGSQVPYPEASPEAKAQAMRFMLETGGQERPLPETPTSPVRTPEQVQSILNEQRATQAPSVESALGATPSVAPPVETPTPSVQGQMGPVASPFLQSPDTPSGLGGPLLRGFEMVNDAARRPNAPMGQDETRARLGGMTLNEYLNAPAGTPGVSGLRTDPQGRMITPAPATVNNFAPQAPSGQTGPTPVLETVPTPSGRGTPVPFPNTEGREIRDALFRGDPGSNVRPLPSNPDAGFTPRPPSLRDPDEGFTPRLAPNLSDFERNSLARQIAIGGTGSFAGDSAAREARLAARPDFNAAISDRDRRGGGLSQADARDLAQGLDPNASESQRMRALQIQSRLGLGQFKPERELTDLEKRDIESQIRSRDADIAAQERKGGFEPRIVTIEGERAMELSPGNFQKLQKDTPNKTGLQKTLENLQADLDSGRLTQEEYDIATKNARDLYIGREKPKGQDTDNEFINIITGAGEGGTPTGDATDAPQVATGRGQARRGRPAQAAPVTINSQAEYDALPAGTPYIDSQGTPGTKQ